MKLQDQKNQQLLSEAYDVEMENASLPDDDYHIRSIGS